MTDPSRMFLSLVLACGVAACASTSTTIEQSWRGPNPASSAPHNIAVVYMSQDGAIRRTAEDNMAAQLVARGVQAVPSYHVLAGQLLVEGQRIHAKRKLTEAGFDGVVTMRLVRRDDVPQSSTLDDFWGTPYASYGYNEVVVRIETNLYSLSDDKLLWSALSQTVDPTGAPMVIDEVTTLVASRMLNEGVVAHTVTASR